MTTADQDPSLPIRDAACLICVDRSKPVALLLMGRRRDDQVFLPGKWVFPGGRVDDADHRAAHALAKGQAGAEADAITAFAIAALRELGEETGLALVSASAGETPLSDLVPLARAITPPGRTRRYDTWFFLTERPLLRTLGQGDGELLDIGWFDTAAARGLDLPIITRFVLDDAIAALANGALRATTVPFYYQSGPDFRRDLIPVPCGSPWP